MQNQNNPALYPAEILDMETLIVENFNEMVYRKKIWERRLWIIIPIIFCIGMGVAFFKTLGGSWWISAAIICIVLILLVTVFMKTVELSRAKKVVLKLCTKRVWRRQDLEEMFGSNVSGVGLRKMLTRYGFTVSQNCVIHVLINRAGEVVGHNKMYDEQERKKKLAEELFALEGTRAEGQGDVFASYFVRIHALNARIPGEEISAKIESLEKLCSSFAGVLGKYPEQRERLRKAVDYYFPTMINMLESCALIEENGVKTEQTRTYLAQAEAFLDETLVSLLALYDRIFADLNLKRAVDAEAMKALYHLEGIAPRDF